MANSCCHIFNVRLSLHIPIFEEGMVPKRWLRSYHSNGMFDQAGCSTNHHASCASGIVSDQDCVHVSNLSTKSKLFRTLASNQMFPESANSVSETSCHCISLWNVSIQREVCANRDSSLEFTLIR